MEEKGVVYILINPSFPDYIKIGYANDLKKRVEALNRSECIPFTFRVYAYYKVEQRLTDMKIHTMIDSINPNLRSIEIYHGKTRRREFYAMTAEQAYSILETIAELSNSKDRLVLVEPSEENIKDEEEADLIKNIPITVDSYLDGKSKDLVVLYNRLFTGVLEQFPDVSAIATKNYIAFRNKKGRNICEVHLYKSSNLILTKAPSPGSPLEICGEKVPDSYLWSLNYRFYFDNSEGLMIAKDLIFNAYRSIGVNKE